ncbi:hypothetical protein Tco_0799559 [Tanacetum coccineum]|uniref:Uncharacterized protein n=1 Tax=Tanacetum coccineum TaxID=301880 RepID=A0ABQ4ZSZ0_9ASTR
MRTRSQARRRRQPQVRQTSVESSNLEKPDNPPLVRWMIIHYYGVTARCTHRGLSWELDTSTSGSGTLSWTCSSQSCHRGDKGHDCLHDNNGSTEDVQPPVVQIQSRNQNPEPNIAPVVPPVPKASIPFPSRRNDERRRKI